jgi:SAM-dependent methyltransferase
MVMPELTGPELDFVRDISPDDEMCMSTPENYYGFGLAALSNVRIAIRIAGNRDPMNILDLPSGYGRVLRMLRAAFPRARVTACDLNNEAVDYCARIFGAIPAYSTEAPAEIDLPGNFDLIWCGSLLTHLDASRWSGFLTLFEEKLASGGIVVFTTHGRGVAEALQEGRRRFGVKDSRALLEGYRLGGFGFSLYAHSTAYGISLSKPAWVCGELERHPGLSLSMYTEGGWNGQQDAVACVRA